MTSTSILGATTVSYTYDGAGRLVGEIDARGNTRSIRYDPLGRVVGYMDALGEEIAGLTDETGRLTARIDRVGTVRELTYSSAGELESVLTSGTEVRSFVHSPTGEMEVATTPSTRMERSHTIRGLLNQTSVVGADSTTLHYVRDPSGRATSRSISGQGVFASADDVVRMTYDESGHPHCILTSGAVDNFCAVRRYDGRVESVALESDLLLERDYDGSGRLTSLVVSQGGSPLVSMEWGYDSRGLPTQEVINGQVRRFVEHAPQGQVLLATEFRDGEEVDTLGYTYTSNPERRHYDNASRLVLDDEYSYEYDAEGRRTSRVSRDTGAVTRYIYDGCGSPHDMNPARLGCQFFERAVT